MPIATSSLERLTFLPSFIPFPACEPSFLPQRPPKLKCPLAFLGILGLPCPQEGAPVCPVAFGASSAHPLRSPLTGGFCAPKGPLQASTHWRSWGPARSVPSARDPSNLARQGRGRRVRVRGPLPDSEVDHAQAEKEVAKAAPRFGVHSPRWPPGLCCSSGPAPAGAITIARFPWKARTGVWGSPGSNVTRGSTLRSHAEGGNAERRGERGRAARKGAGRCKCVKARGASGASGAARPRSSPVRPPPQPPPRAPRPHALPRRPLPALGCGAVGKATTRRRPPVSRVSRAKGSRCGRLEDSGMRWEHPLASTPLKEFLCQVQGMLASGFPFWGV